MGNTITLNYTGTLKGMTLNAKDGYIPPKEYSIYNLPNNAYITEIKYRFNISSILSYPRYAKFKVRYVEAANKEVEVNIEKGSGGGTYSAIFNISEFPQIKNLTNGNFFEIELYYNNTVYKEDLVIKNAHLEITFEYKPTTLSTPTIQTSPTTLYPDSNTIDLTWSESNSTGHNVVKEYWLYIDGEYTGRPVNSLQYPLTVNPGESHSYRIKAISDIEGYDSQLSEPVVIKCYDEFIMPELEVCTNINNTKISSKDKDSLYVGSNNKPTIYAEWNLGSISTEVDRIETITFAGQSQGKDTNRVDLTDYNIGNTLQLKISMISGQSGTKNIKIKEIEPSENYSLTFSQGLNLNPETVLDVSWTESPVSETNIKEIRYLRIIKNSKKELLAGTTNESININGIVDYGEQFDYELTPRFYAQYGGYIEGTTITKTFTRSDQPEITVTIKSDISSLPTANYALKDFTISLSGQGTYKNISLQANNQEIHSGKSIDDFKNFRHSIEAFDNTEIIYKIVATTSSDRTIAYTYPSYYKYQPPKIILNENSINQIGSAPNVKVSINGTVQDRFGNLQNCSYRLSMSYENGGYKELKTGDVTSGELIIVTGEDTLKVGGDKINSNSLKSLYDALTTWEGNKLKVGKPTVSFKIDLWDKNIGESIFSSATKEHTLDYTLKPSNVRIGVSNPKDSYSSGNTLTFISKYDITDFSGTTNSFWGTVKQISPIVIEDVGTFYEDVGISYELKPIQNDTTYYFKAVARFEYGDGFFTKEESPGTVEVKVCRHMSPIVQVYDLKINDDGKLEGNVLIIPRGSDDENDLNKNLDYCILYIYEGDSDSPFAGKGELIGEEAQIEIDIKDLNYSQTFEKNSNYSFRFEVYTYTNDESPLVQNTIIYASYRPSNVPLSIRKGRVGINVGDNFGKGEDKTGPALSVTQVNNEAAAVEIFANANGGTNNYFTLKENGTNKGYSIYSNGTNVIIDNLFVSASAITGGEIGGTLADDCIPNLNIADKTFGTLSSDRIEDLDTSKITTGKAFDLKFIPDLSPSKITTDTEEVFDPKLIPNLNIADKTTGKLPYNRIIVHLNESDITGTLSTDKGGTGASNIGAAPGAALCNLGIIYQETQPSPKNGLIWLKPKG